MQSSSSSAKRNFDEQLEQARVRAVEDFKNSMKFGKLQGDFGVESYNYGLNQARAFLSPLTS